MHNSMKLVLASSLAGVFMLTGCETVGNVDLNKFITQSTQDQTFEFNEKVGFDLSFDQKKVVPSDELLARQLFSHVDLEVHGISQDKESFSLDGNVVVSEGKIPFSLYGNKQEFYICLDNASKPIRIENKNQNIDFQQLDESLVTAFVRNIPNAKDIGVTDVTQNVHGENVKGKNVHLQLNGLEIPDLVVKLLENLSNDKDAITQFTNFANQLSTKNGGVPTNPAIVEQMLKTAVVEVKKSVEEAKTNHIFTQDQSITMNFLIDDQFHERSAKGELNLKIQDENSGIDGIHVTMDMDKWNINQPSLQATKMEVKDYLSENLSRKEFLNTLDPNKSLLYKVLVRDFKFNQNQIKLKVNDPAALVNDELVDLGVAPFIENDSTLVPVKAVAEGLEAKVEWDEQKNQAIITKDNDRIVFQVNSKIADVNGNKVELQAPARILKNKLFVPLRTVGESLHAKVEWVPEDQSITITNEN
jgi:hypothetical protein